MSYANLVSSWPIAAGCVDLVIQVDNLVPQGSTIGNVVLIKCEEEFLITLPLLEPIEPIIVGGVILDVGLEGENGYAEEDAHNYGDHPAVSEV